MDFDFRDLEIFCKVVELASFSRAAVEVQLSQASVSERIAALERDVGGPLLDRLGRATVPTQLGKLLYRHATELLGRKRQICLELESALDIHRGAVEIGGSTIPGEYLLPGVVGRFRREYPKVSVSVVIDDTSHVANMVLEGVLELGVVGSRPKVKHLACKALWNDEMVVVVPAGHPWASRRFVKIDELATEPFLAREPGSGTRQVFERHLRKLGIDALEVVAQLGSSAAVKEGVKSGAGIAIISALAVADDIESGLLVRVNVRDLAITRRFYLIRDRRRAPSPLSKLLQRFLLTEAASD